MKNLLILLSVALIVSAASAAIPPSFRDTAAPDGWTVVSGETSTGVVVQAKTAGAVHLGSGVT